MKHYVTPNKDGENFTAGKHYKIMYEYTNDRVLVLDDKGNSVIVRIDGIPSARLNWGGKFARCSELLDRALTTAENVEKLVEEVRPEVETQIRVESVFGKGWSLNTGGKVLHSAGFRAAIESESLTERLRKAEHDRDLYKQDCIKAEAVIDQLYELFPHTRNHEQLIAAIKSAKIFSDAFLELQKIK